MKKLNKQNVLKALKSLDNLVSKPFEMIIGGGTAMLCAYDSPLQTFDVDVILKNTTMKEIEKAVWQVSEDMGLPKDWLNSWYAGFTHILPESFSKRLQLIFKGKKIKAYVLGMEDLLIMKCCAHRAKDIGHARILIRKKVDYEFVLNHLEKLTAKNILPNFKPIEFLEEILDQELI